MAAVLGKGFTLTLSGVGTNYANSVQIVGLRKTPRERSAILTTIMASTSGYHTKIPGGFVDPGTVELDVQMDPNLGDNVPLTSGVLGCILNFGSTYSWNGFVISESWDAPMEDKITGTFVIQLSGPPVWGS